LYTLQELGFSLAVPELLQYIDQPEHSQSLFIGLREFQEHLGGRLTIMLLCGIGQGMEVYEVALKHYRAAVIILLFITQYELTSEDTSTIVTRSTNEESKGTRKMIVT
jgi:hypothetical protein